MSDFLRVSEVLAAFPNPKLVRLQTIRERFGVTLAVASFCRKLAIEFVEVRQHEARGLSRQQAEAMVAINRKRRRYQPCVRVTKGMEA